VVFYSSSRAAWWRDPAGSSGIRATDPSMKNILLTPTSCNTQGGGCGLNHYNNYGLLQFVAPEASRPSSGRARWRATATSPSYSRLIEDRSQAFGMYTAGGDQRDDFI